jgi:hypothetical protein
MSYISSQNTELRTSLISNFLISELLASHAEVLAIPLYLISPWITNFTLSLPTGSDLSAIIDSAEQIPRLFDVIGQITENGREVHVAILPEYEPARIATFVAPLLELAKLHPRLILRQVSQLHAKIYVGRFGGLYGSHNLTESGTSRNIEFSSFASDKRTVSRLQSEARKIFESGGVIS